MKKVFILIMCVMVFVGIAAAQTYTQGTGISGGNHDILGAHNDGGRGCAGCHAPHSGGQGGGGNAATNAAAFSDAHSGDDALFGQDLTPLYGKTLNFGDNGGYAESFPTNANFTTGNYEIRGIMMCLACHDGNIAKGGMMSGQLYEQKVGLLPTGANGQALYGSSPIPTLLGADNPGNLGDYNNDHPVGVAANFGRLGLSKYMTLSMTGSGNGIAGVSVTSAAYTQFVANYGIPSILGTSWDYGFATNGDGIQNNAYVTCLTCHNQHVMYVYQAPAAYTGHTATGSKIAPGGNYPTYFFINAPYNPGAWGTVGNDPTKAPSTTQFCRQCHFGEANEAYGVNNVQTAF